MKQRLAAVAANLGIAAILLGAPAVLWATRPRPVLPVTWPQLRDRLLSPDDGTLALAAIWLVALIAWIVLAAMLCAEIAAALRGVRTRRVPGLHIPQELAQHLVATAAVLYLASPALAPTAGGAPEAPAVTSPMDTSPAHSAKAPAFADVELLSAPAAAPRHINHHYERTVEHVVARGESLWRIAEQHLGSGSRYREIVALNRDLLGGNPDFLKVGWVLKLPASADDKHRDRGAHQYTVRKGDTLSEIALEQLGNAHRWPEIAMASAHIRQPGGRHPTDPDQIDVGWILKIPANHTPKAKSSRREDPPAEHQTPAKPGAPSVAADIPPEPPDSKSTPAASATAQAGPSAPEASAIAETDEYVPGWLLTGLAGGLVLAGSMWITLHNRRALQFRHRRPGRMITLPPPEAIPAEKTLIRERGPAMNMVALIHASLLGLATQLAGTRAHAPRLIAAEATQHRITLHFEEPSALPEPWQGEGVRWTLTSDRVDELPAPPDGQPAPWPQLVAIGTSPDGATWLTNLEHHGAISLGGDPEVTTDLLRYLCAEIAVNRWCRDSTAYLDETTRCVQPINPQRLRSAGEPRLHERLLSETIQLIDRAKEARLDLATARAWQEGADIWPSILLALDETPTGDAASELLKLAVSHTRSAGLTILCRGQIAGSVSIEIDASRHLTVPGTDVVVRAVGLSADEAAGCAALLAAAADLDDQPMPVVADAGRWLADDPGFGREVPELHRPDDGPAGSTSLLPLPNEDYLAVAATTPEDLDRLAPPQLPLTDTDDPDPTLDADLAAWYDDTCPQPKLSILGPVSARSGPDGRIEATTDHLGMLIEILTILAVRPHGATVDELAEAVSIEPGRVRKELMLLREWLGDNPRTGRKFVPDARHTEAARQSGRPVYQVEDLLSDADLFTRLRRRARRRGEAGVDDLVAALRLVEGEPLTRLRNGIWLTEGDRIDHHYSSAIADVAHVVVVCSLASADVEQARFAAEVACLAMPYDENARLDMADVIQAEGRDEQAQRYLADQVLNRNEDGDCYPDIPSRSVEILERKHWRPQRRRVG